MTFFLGNLKESTCTFRNSMFGDTFRNSMFGDKEVEVALFFYIV